jgi:protein O-mannosyl-transferase
VGDGPIWPHSLFVAALFALHPINVESVAWIAERKNVLCTMFFFLTLWAYGWYARKPDWKRYLAVAALQRQNW